MAPKSNVSNASSAVGGPAGSDVTPSRTATLPQKDAAARRKQASNDWVEFQDIIPKMLKNAHLYADIDQLVKDHSAAQNKLDEKIAEISEKDRQISFLEGKMFNSFEARCKTWTAKTTDFKLQTENEKTLAEAVYKKKVESLETQIRTLKEKVNSLNASLGKATEEADLAKEECDFSKRRLQEWDGYLSELRDMDFDSLEAKLDQFFQRCLNVMNMNFFVDLPNQLLKDTASWEKLAKKLGRRLSFPPSNSNEAKLMRVAAAFHVFATRLHSEIFRPWYVPESVDESWIVKNVLDHDFRSGSRKGDVVRALLLSNRRTEDEGNVVAGVARRASESVHKQLHFFLGDDGQKFKTSVEELFCEAASLWLEMQHNKKEIEAQIQESLDYDNSWIPLDAFGELVAHQHIPRPEALYLFPRLHVPGDKRILHRGCVLWLDQSAVISAHQERHEYKPNRSTGGSSARESARRDSFGFDILSPPNSPTSKKKDFLGGGTAMPSRRTNSQIQDH